jgi:ketosteroid isomerase-like protein
MTEEQIKNTVRNYLQVSASGDVNRSLLFLAKDSEVITGGQTFKGIDEIRKYLTWMSSNTKDFKVTETGMGIVAEANTAVVEHIISGIARGKRLEIPAVCIYEFKNDRIQSIRGFNDRLGMARQAARGPFERWMVNMMINASEKGLR